MYIYYTGREDRERIVQVPVDYLHITFMEEELQDEDQLQTGQFCRPRLTISMQPC